MLGVKKKPQTTNNESSQSVIYTSSSKVQLEPMDKILKCMNILMEIACQSNRNVIIDQVHHKFQINCF